MKKTLILIFTAFMAVSCFDSKYESNYTLLMNFDDMTNYTDKEFYGDDNVFYEQAFWHEDVYFENKFLEGDFSGFALSIANLKNNPEHGWQACNSETAADGSKGFAVFYNNAGSLPLKHHIQFLLPRHGTFTPVFCYMNNSSYVADAVKGSFQKGDYLKLIIKGIKEEKEVARKEVVLAEYTEAKDSVMNTWSKIDLSTLGAVEHVDFEFSMSQPGMVPEYFCMDNFCADIHIIMQKE